MTESDEIEEVLYEASYLGIRDKVMGKAADWIKRKKMPKSVAYRRALEKYRKKGRINIGSNGVFGEIKHSEK